MKWSNQQVQALDLVGQWLKDKSSQIFKLGGYAGTGKTTLARHLASQMNGRVYFAAYTGKAAHVLIKAGCENVSTIHKLIYVPKDKSKIRLQELGAQLAQAKVDRPLNEDLVRRLERAVEQEKINLSRPSFNLNSESPLHEASLLVVDEYSMINEQMGEDLLSFGCKILALGDPAQIKPVFGECFFKGDPDFMLTEIHRQAEENPIIHMSRLVREGKRLELGTYGESRVLNYRNVDREEVQQRVLTADQLLVGRNATRVSSNIRARQLLGLTSHYPMEDDKLICLRNDHELGLLNGQIWYAMGNADYDGDFVHMMIRGEDNQKLRVTAHPQYFQGGKPEYWQLREANEFDFGYAMTVHKSQGSQWDDIILFDEWYNQDRRNWLYTAITRAAVKIDVIQM